MWYAAGLILNAGYGSYSVGSQTKTLSNKKRPSIEDRFLLTIIFGSRLQVSRRGRKTAL